MLEALCEVAATPAERAGRRLHRAMLLDDKRRDPAGACDELLRAYDDLKRRPTEVTVEAIEGWDEAPKAWLDAEDHEDPVRAMLSKALILSRRVERWDLHLRALEASIHGTTDPGLIAELYSRAGDVYADQLLGRIGRRGRLPLRGPDLPLAPAGQGSPPGVAGGSGEVCRGC